MKVVARDPRERLVKLLPENLDDLWHLHQLVRPGDLVRMVTWRRMELPDDKLRGEKAEKKPMLLGVRVERVEFHEFANRLRILGTIEEGPQEHGAHHTLSVEPRDELSIVKKEWPAHDHERIDEAVAAARRPLLTVVAMDDGEATVAVLHHYGIREAATIRGPGTGKRSAEDPSARGRYFAQVRDAVQLARPTDGPLLVVGPGFAPAAFHRFLAETAPEHAKRSLVQATGSAGRAGIQEALARGIVERLDATARVAQETRLVERFLAEVGRGAGLAAYGAAEVERALGLGAAETLLVTDLAVRERGAEALLGKARSVRAQAHVISTVHEAGKRLEAMGGAGALLRYKLPS
ncbi:MAG TPA: mRNA surveillance protein pelota [Candidatus Thermoplasmatota archaeon]|nr:mRNA surveillance protein pelota [Candidatus Thermoplasmatota archaeon]